jgi:hypothetical protein
MSFITGIQSWLQKIGKIFSILINLDEVINEIKPKPLQTLQPLQKAYYGIYGTLYSFDGKTFERVLKLTTDDVEYPDTLSGMLTMCTINGLSYFNINGKIYSFDGAKFTYVETLRLPEELTPNMVNKNTYISVI